jgi:hypothetical protein
MISQWYLVKGGWPKNGPKFPVKRPCPLYAGLGGQVWPFDSGFNFDKGAKNELQNLHTRMERSRVFVDFRPYVSVCPDVVIAEEYFAAVKKHCGEAWLLQVSLPNTKLSEISGYDIGFPNGGYSVIETELITQGLPGPDLNEWGLIKTLPEALAYVEERKVNKELEQWSDDEITIVSLKILSRS